MSKITLFLTVFAPVLCAQRAVQQIEVERKLALVIGNDAYPSEPLKYPANDAVAMEATLKKLGFEVRTNRNLDLAQMETAIDEFAASVTEGSFAFFYFTGTAIQAVLKNYLLPVNFAFTRDPEDVKSRAYPVSRLQDKLDARHARLRVIVLEACRGTRFGVGGLGLVPMPVNREGSLVAFAAYSNPASDDVDNSNSLYTRYLMAALLTPGMNLRDAFQKAREDSYQAARSRGYPEIFDGIVGRYHLLPATTASGPRAGTPDEAALEWAKIENSKDPHDFDVLARYYPDSEYAPLARVTAAQLRQDAAAAITKINAKDGLVYRWIPPGTFSMGCSYGNDKECDADEKPEHDVALSKGFWLGQTEVTQEAYQRVTGRNPSEFKGARLPVETVNWNEAQAYCKATGMRLPTEAESEYAARGGNRSDGYGWLASGAWYQEASQSKTHEVAQLPANSFGLYDMAGNVWEWVADWYDEKYYASSQLSDPPGAAVGHDRIFRGGSWTLNSYFMLVSLRGHNQPGFRSSAIGIRCAGD